MGGDVLKLRGAAQFRQRIALATLAGRAIRIDDIRYDDEAPGLRPEEANFLRLIEKLTNGCAIEINETGTSLLYRPGVLAFSHAGEIKHDCGTARAVRHDHHHHWRAGEAGGGLALRLEARLE